MKFLWDAPDITPGRHVRDAVTEYLVIEHHSLGLMLVCLQDGIVVIGPTDSERMAHHLFEQEMLPAEIS